MKEQVVGEIEPEVRWVGSTQTPPTDRNRQARVPRGTTAVGFGVIFCVFTIGLVLGLMLG